MISFKYNRYYREHRHAGSFFPARASRGFDPDLHAGSLHDMGKAVVRPPFRSLVGALHPGSVPLFLGLLRSVVELLEPLSFFILSPVTTFQASL